MSVLTLIICLYVLDDNNKMIHYHKMSNLSNNRKFEFLSHFNLYILKKLLNFVNEERARINKNMNKVNKFKFFKRNLVVSESMFSIIINRRFEKILFKSLESLKAFVVDMFMFDSKTTRNKFELRFCF